MDTITILLLILVIFLLAAVFAIIIYLLRNKYHCNDDFVIYTGYKEEEVEDKVKQLSQYPNVIMKFGRFVPNQESRYDEVMGINLASPNQYGKKIS